MTPTSIDSVVRPKAREGSFSYATLHDVMVPMRDGIRLASDIYLPARDGRIAEGPFPVVIERTPYDKRRWPNNCPDGAFWAQRGYAYVNQDCRGRFHSEGVFQSYPQESDDGVDAVSWIMRQPWCNGRIGVTGSSYFASTAQAILVNKAPGVVAAVIRVGAGNYYEDGAWSGGAFQLTHNVNYALGLAANGPTAAADARVRESFARSQTPAAAFDLMQRSPLKAGQSVFALSPDDEAWYLDWQRHEREGDYWAQNGYSFDYRKAADLPVLLIGEWYDAFNGGMLDAFVGYREGKKGPVSMIMGGGFHSSVYDTGSVAGDVDMGADFPIHVPAVILDWFDRYLREETRQPNDKGAFHAFRIEGGDGRKTASGRLKAGGSWQSFPTWPPVDARETRWYLTSDLKLKTAIPDDGALTYSYDPQNPVPTVGGAVSSGGQIVPAGPYDQRNQPNLLQCSGNAPLNARADVLSFVSDPLKSDLEVSGQVSVTLHVSSSAVDTDFTAKLIDQYPPSADYPDGYAMNLLDGIVRARLRKFKQAGPGYRRVYGQSEEKLAPGEIVTVVIDLWATSALFRVGHRIRLDVSSSNFPRFDANTNTGEAFADRKLPPIVARNSIHLGAAHPSFVSLPIRGTAK